MHSVCVRGLHYVPELRVLASWEIVKISFKIGILALLLSVEYFFWYFSVNVCDRLEKMPVAWEG